MTAPRPKYKPKFCRTRRCTLPFDHEGAHDGAPTRIALPWPHAMAPRGRVTVYYRAHKSPKAARVPGVAERMASYRVRPVRRPS